MLTARKHSVAKMRTETGRQKTSSTKFRFCGLRCIRWQCSDGPLSALQFDRGANGAATWTNDPFNVMRSIPTAPLSDRFPPFTLT